MKGFLNKVQRRTSHPGPNDDGSPDNTVGPSSPTNTNSSMPFADMSDVVLPKSTRDPRRRASFSKKSKSAQVKELPPLNDTPMQKRDALFRQKLQLCCIVFNFYDQDLDIRGKECKRETLVELAEYVNTPVGQKIFTEAAMPDIIEMVRVNLFRTLPPPTEDLDIEDEEGNIEPAWPHLQIIYELFLRFIISPEVNGKAAKKFVDAAFLRSWIELFDAEDPRERDYVKTILHRMYGKFMSYRSNIRRTISQVFYRYIYETGRHNGIAELLEILGSIINGFAIPLKREHLLFLENALIPLHKPAGIAVYHPQLSYCISQYVEKDPETVVVIVQGLIRFWPWTNAAKQVLFLNELEEILELCRGEQFSQIQHELYRLLELCLSSEHFQVTERTLYYWNSESLCVNVLAPSKAEIFLPYVFGPLTRHAKGHWNQTVEGLAQSVLKMYAESDQALYDKCLRENNEKTRIKDAEREKARAKWLDIQKTAAAKGIFVEP